MRGKILWTVTGVAAVAVAANKIVTKLQANKKGETCIGAGDPDLCSRCGCAEFCGCAADEVKAKFADGIPEDTLNKELTDAWRHEMQTRDAIRSTIKDSSEEIPCEEVLSSALREMKEKFPLNSVEELVRDSWVNPEALKGTLDDMSSYLDNVRNILEASTDEDGNQGVVKSTISMDELQPATKNTEIKYVASEPEFGFATEGSDLEIPDTALTFVDDETDEEFVSDLDFSAKLSDILPADSQEVVSPQEAETQDGSVSMVLGITPEVGADSVSDNAETGICHACIAECSMFGFVADGAEPLYSPEKHKAGALRYAKVPVVEVTDRFEYTSVSMEYKEERDWGKQPQDWGVLSVWRINKDMLLFEISAHLLRIAAKHLESNDLWYEFLYKVYQWEQQEYLHFVADMPSVLWVSADLTHVIEKGTICSEGEFTGSHKYGVGNISLDELNAPYVDTRSPVGLYLEAPYLIKAEEGAYAPTTFSVVHNGNDSAIVYAIGKEVPTELPKKDGVYLSMETILKPLNLALDLLTQVSSVEVSLVRHNRRGLVPVAITGSPKKTIPLNPKTTDYSEIEAETNLPKSGVYNVVIADKNVVEVSPFSNEVFECLASLTATAPRFDGKYRVQITSTFKRAFVNWVRVRYKYDADGNITDEELDPTSMVGIDYDYNEIYEPLTRFRPPVDGIFRVGVVDNSVTEAMWREETETGLNERKSRDSDVDYFNTVLQIQPKSDGSYLVNVKTISEGLVDTIWTPILPEMKYESFAEHVKAALPDPSQSILTDLPEGIYFVHKSWIYPCFDIRNLISVYNSPCAEAYQVMSENPLGIYHSRYLAETYTPDGDELAIVRMRNVDKVETGVYIRHGDDCFIASKADIEFYHYKRVSVTDVPMVIASDTLATMRAELGMTPDGFVVLANSWGRNKAEKAIRRWTENTASIKKRADTIYVYTSRGLLRQTEGSLSAHPKASDEWVSVKLGQSLVQSELFKNVSKLPVGVYYAEGTKLYILDCIHQTLSAFVCSMGETGVSYKLFVVPLNDQKLINQIETGAFIPFEECETPIEIFDKSSQETGALKNRAYFEIPEQSAPMLVVVDSESAFIGDYSRCVGECLLY